MNIREMLKEKEEFEKNVKHSPEELDRMWSYCLEKGHALICQLDRCGKDWRDLNTNCIATLEKEYLKIKDKESEL